MQQRSTATRKPQPHLLHQPSDAGRSFDGDLSCWGKTHMEDSYYEDGLTSGSLSSGLSPRESRPRHREWDPAEAMQVCASVLLLLPTRILRFVAVIVRCAYQGSPS